MIKYVNPSTETGLPLGHLVRSGQEDRLRHADHPFLIIGDPEHTSNPLSSTPESDLTDMVLGPQKGRGYLSENAMVIEIQRSHANAIWNRIVIGRKDTCDLQILGTDVSREHAAIFCGDDTNQWFLVDLGSRNGTRLDGRLIPAHVSQSLYCGAEICFGATVQAAWCEPEGAYTLACLASSLGFKDA